MKLTNLLTTGIIILFWNAALSQYWGANTQSNFTNEAYDIETDNQGNSYVCGYYTGETYFNSAVAFSNPGGNGDIFIAKYSSNGALLWSKRFGGNFSDRAYELELSDIGEIVVAGQFFGTVDFGGVSLQSAGNSKDIFVLKLDGSGNVLWAIKEGGSQEENVFGLEVDHLGEVILTGQFKGNSMIGGQSFTSMIDPQLGLPSFDFFVSKYGNNGVAQWVNVGQTEYEDRGMAVAVDASNNIFLTGQFSDTLSFAGQIYNNAAYNIGFISKLSSSGNVMWFNKMTGGMCVPYDIEVNSLQQPVLIGDFLGTFMYWENGLQTGVIANSFSRKSFVMKLSNGGNYLWGTSVGSSSYLSSRALAINPNKDIYVVGNFECSLTEWHSPNYVFNSAGFKDIFIWKISDSGISVYSRQVGGQLNDEGHGIAVINSEPIIAGGYTKDLCFPVQANSNLTTGGASPYNLMNTNSGPFYSLSGDLSRNFFITNLCNNTLELYNYFTQDGFNPYLDSLEGQIDFSDTVFFCDEGLLEYYSKTFEIAGPLYNYLWSTGGTMDEIYVTTSGVYTIEVERQDQCQGGLDSIFVIVNPTPSMPLQNDNLGLAVNQPAHYLGYNLCEDSVQIWFTNLASGLAFQVTDQSGQLITNSPGPVYYNNGHYNVTVSDSFCSNTDDFVVVVFDSLNFNLNVIPYIIISDTNAQNDSLTVCQNERVYLEFLDSTNNPNGVMFLIPDDTAFHHSWTIFDPNGLPISYFDASYEFQRISFYPTTSGWYTAHCDGIYGGINECNVDTTWFPADYSFYVEVLAVSVPITTLTVSNLLCPSGSVYVYANPLIPGFSWSNSNYTQTGITWQSASMDSIIVNLSGGYIYDGTYLNPNGCSVDYLFSIPVLEKQPPIVQIDPMDAIICPFDSVLMSVPDTFLTYQWFGPSGQGLSFTHTHTDVEQGFYYCTVQDSDSCSLTSPQVELNEYSTPYLTVEPSNIFCGDSIEIHVVYEGNGLINWLPPLSGNASSVHVVQPGWYSCEITQCGITVIDSVEIIDGTFAVVAFTLDSIICDNETTQIFTNQQGTIEWSNGSFGSPATIDQPGIYFATVTNSYGCEAVSNSVSISTSSYPTPYNIPDSYVCSSGSVTLSTNSGAVNWYNASFDSLGVSDYLVVNPINSDTVVYFVQPVADCPPIYQPVLISAYQPILDLSYTGDTAVCEGLDIQLFGFSSSADSLSWHSLTGNILSTTSSIVVPANALTNVLLIGSNSCYSDSLLVNMTWHTTQTLVASDDTLALCPYDNVIATTLNGFNSISWIGNNQIVYEDTLSGNALDLSGLWQVNALDQYGCEMNPDSIWIEPSYDYLYIDTLQMNYCHGDTVLLFIQSSFDSIEMNMNGNISWITDTLSFVLDSTWSGQVILTATNFLGCNFTDTFDIPLPLTVFSNWSQDTVLCLGSVLSYNGISNGYIDLNWNNGSVIPSQSDTIYFILSDSIGCGYIDSIAVTVVNCDNQTPNVITPNNDGSNDYLFIDDALVYTNNRLIILNRWGNLVYETNNYQNNFDGADLKEGVYFYVFYRDKSDQNAFVTQNLHIIR